MAQGRGVVIQALVALTNEAADGTIQSRQRQMQGLGLLKLGGCQPSITSNQAQTNRGMNVGHQEPGGVVVRRVDERRGEGVKKRGQDDHGNVLYKCADVVTGARGVPGWAAIPLDGAQGPHRNVVIGAMAEVAR